ncbi:MAG: hypothetical protein F4100_00625 [Rhodothermaceae bacterium]|nr:hypothetical protein [Rhodothermaceae bacterium]MYE62357.1 hypothetical protein [Rhodothermaceae bacterium]MYJ19239.1 hypothetical protein [Rhodothermaceae bacterium]
MSKESEIRLPVESAPIQSERADKELDAIKYEGLRGRHALELKVTELIKAQFETEIRHLATKADVERAKTFMIWSLISMGVTITVAAISLIRTIWGN